MGKLEAGQTALVTGSSWGIGRAFAQLLAARGLDVVLVARDKIRLEQLAREIETEGGRAEVLAADLGDPAQLRAVEERLRADPPIQLFVNNAALGASGRFGSVLGDRVGRRESCFTPWIAASGDPARRASRLA